jgi:hypothetical protein
VNFFGAASCLVLQQYSEDLMFLTALGDYLDPPDRVTRALFDRSDNGWRGGEFDLREKIVRDIPG